MVEYDRSGVSASLVLNRTLIDSYWRSGNLRGSRVRVKYSLIFCLVSCKLLNSSLSRTTTRLVVSK